MHENRIEPQRRRRPQLTAADIRLAIELHRVHGLSTREIAEKFEVTDRAVRYWLAGTRRMGR